MVCRIALDTWESCPSPTCPCYGTRAGSPEMDAAAERWRSRPSVAAQRTMTADAAYDLVEMRAWLDYAEAAADLVEFEEWWG